ncbi:hypothetical protein B0H14DRAFT_3873676 [Mycena olivaceomarginata]|nr:hypothetical protein B0H14DRAFT_3873676 [Mycena olivaceomarginata]
MVLLGWTLLLPLLSPAFAQPAKRAYYSHNYYVLEHDPSTGVPLNDVAQTLGVEVVEQAGELVNHWLVRVEKPDSESGLDARGEQLFDRVLDTYTRLRRDDLRRSNPIASSVRYLARQTLRQRVKRAPPPIPPPTDFSAHAVADRLSIPGSVVHETMAPRQRRVDDGLDYTSEDLKDNFDAADSYDFNDHEDLPTPKLSDDHHGTRCAGQVAAGKNAACGLGLAYESKVAGVRILSGPISDIDEAASLNYGFQNVSIYRVLGDRQTMANQWKAQGISSKKPSSTALTAGVLGWAPSTFLQVETVQRTETNAISMANMIVAYSSGSGKSIVTTDKGVNECATTHGGTSACRSQRRRRIRSYLRDQADPDLTWRDIQHLCVLTARQINKDDPDWEATAMPGRFYSYKYGFGALDAYAYVKAAQTWTVVKPQVWFTTQTIQLEGGVMPQAEEYSGGAFIGEGGVSSSLDVTREMVRDNNFEKLEHINVKVWIQHGKRGDVEVELRSPTGIRSILGGKRTGDTATTGYPGWTFMTVKHWGENPVGTWTIRVSDQGASSNFNGSFPGLEHGTLCSRRMNRLPRRHRASSMASPTSTERGRPTAHLPGDHGEAPGENTNATFPGSEDAAVSPFPSPSPSGTSTPTADEGWFSDMSNLVKSQAWFFGAVGAVAVFGLGLGVYFWRRRVQARGLRDYSSLPEGDELPMSGVRGGRLAGGGGPRTKELYDAFGEVSDGEEDDADEQTRLRSGYEDEHRAGRVEGAVSGRARRVRRWEDAASPDKGAMGAGSMLLLEL